MIAFILRQLWRLIIFILGVYALYTLIEIFWPESGGRVAIFAALLIIYCLMAYLVIPAMFRLYHFAIDHDHIPLYATYGDGWASDPVNIAIVTKDINHLRKAMKDAGWYEADHHSLKNNLREAASILFNLPYPNAPVSTLYLFNRRHDIAFEIPTNGRMSARTRHHVRFWRLEPPRHNLHDRGHFEFWSEKLKKWLHREREIWIGASTEDFRPLDIRWRTGSLTHGVRHDADKERDFIVQSLEDSGYAKSVDTSDPGEQFKFRGQSFRTIYTTDGSLKIVRLK
jgi:hypothetical protein